MLDIRSSAARRAGDLPRLRLPIRILLATRGAPTPETAFNVVGMVRRLLGRQGDEGAGKVYHPFVYSGDATDAEILRFVESEWVDPDYSPSPTQGNERTGTGRSIEDLRLGHFPVAGSPVADARATFDIVHFAGGGFTIGKTAMFPLDPGNFALSAGEMRDALIRSACRLLILQVDSRSLGWANVMAEWIVGSGGPSVLVVHPTDRVAAERFFVRFYLELLHNEALTQSAIYAETDGVSATLHLCQGGDREWNFQLMVEEVKNRLAAVEREADRQQFRRLVETATRFQHAAETRAALSLAESVAAVARTDDGTDVRAILEQLRFDRESLGVVPLSRAAEAVQRLEALEPAVAALRRRAEGRDAPRVLNANFRHVGGEMLAPDEAFLPERAYELLVDVGPRWDRALSLVRGSAEFPADALPPNEEGHAIEVVFASDDFEERMAATSLWLPRTGRSQPIVDGRPQPDSGPVALRLTTPSLAEGAPSRELHGRLCLYFENNLLQSAKVRVRLGREGAEADGHNLIEVDYVLTGGFRAIGRLESRNLRPGSGVRPITSPPDFEPQRVALNLTLNDDGGGTHRIIVPSLGTPAAIGYDPLSGERVLAEARRQLLDLFWERDLDGTVTARVGEIGANNEKTMDAFKRDLLILARHGARLFAQLFAKVRPPDGQSGAQWIAALRAAIAHSSIIQIARTGPAQYAFPWSLVYDFPLPGPSSEFRFCKAIREWESEGGRTGDVPDVCPAGDHSAHENRLCPYGFWGLRHRIEQPPTLPRPSADVAPVEPVRRIGVGGVPTLQVALTSDEALDTTSIDRHVDRLAGLAGLAFAPPSATDREAVSRLLHAPQLVYFLCHGEYDPARDEPYLGVGLRDGQDKHRLYASDLGQILTSSRVDPDGWKRNAPLVFINGCHTADLQPGQVWNFVESFTQAGASGVIGTEVSVRLPVATEAAEILMTQIASNEAVADAIRTMRWVFANKRNLLSLAYTPYCLSDLRLG